MPGEHAASTPWGDVARSYGRRTSETKLRTAKTGRPRSGVANKTTTGTFCLYKTIMYGYVTQLLKQIRVVASFFVEISYNIYDKLTINIFIQPGTVEF